MSTDHDVDIASPDPSDDDISSVDHATVRARLREVFGHEDLRPGQARAVETTLAGRDGCVVMPTGAGKSLCYQLPTVVAGGLTVVVSPLISLMKDQVDSLRKLGIAAATLNSSQDYDEATDVLNWTRNGELRFLFVAPERLGNRTFLDAVMDYGVTRVAVDEAHCASMWGHDFRPDYLRIADFIERVGHPPTLALTATATPWVRDDMVRILGLRDPELIVTGFDRPNLALNVVSVRTRNERRARLVEFVKEVPTAMASDRATPSDSSGAVIVYAGSRKNVELVAGDLAGAGIDVGYYHAGRSAADRTSVQDSFMNAETNVIVATNAFGMGIDRSDVRLVIHFDLPGSLEAYYQEVGRAGRDGKPARGVLLFSEESVRLQHFFVDAAHPSVELIRRVMVTIADATPEEPVDARSLEDVFETEVRPGIGSAVGVLIGVGAVARRGMHGELTALMAPDAVELDIEGLAGRRDMDERKLDIVLGYARRRRCRNDVVLDYFGADEVEGEGGCGRCDVCVGAASGRDLDDDELVELKKILSGVARCRGYAGKKRIALMLLGSTAKEVRGTFLENLSTFGILRSTNRDELMRKLDATVEAGLVDITGDRYPVLRLAEKGRDALTDKVTVKLDWPRGGRGRSSSMSSPSTSSIGSTQGADYSDLDADVVARIEAWRRDKAADRGLPAYCIFGNRTLADLVARAPTNRAELEAVHGLGPKRVDDYGDELLELLTSE